jgi:cytochrome c biogenesis protein CcdA
MSMDTSSRLKAYRYQLLFGAYVIITGAAIMRVARQPYSRSMKFDQIESIFKATTLGAVLLGIGMSGKINEPRSTSN